MANTSTTFSINALSHILDRDRRTVTRALRNVSPSGFEGKGKRRAPVWTMPIAIAALDALEPKQDTSAGDATFERELDKAERAFDQAVAALVKLPTLAARRARAPACAVFADTYAAALKRRGTAQGLHAQHTELVCEQSRRLMLQALAEPCQWPQVYLEIGG